jgi:hypothetical protein
VDRSTCLGEAQLCALVSKGNGECPTGSASSYKALLVLELPRPWPSKVLQAPHLYDGVRDTLTTLERAGTPLSVLTVEPDEVYSQPGFVRLLYFRRPEGMFAEFERLEHLVPEPEVGAFVNALVLQGDVTTFAPYRQETRGRDLLVCSHETRDICCGRFGEEAYRALRFLHPDVRVWRSSHIGGHKFAPTLIDLPSGRFWGHLEPHTYAGIVHDTLELTELKKVYRGWSGLGKLEQHAERAAFESEGWGWAGAKKSGRVISAVPERDEVTVELTFVRQDGTEGSYEAVVSCTGHVETLASSGDAPRVSVKQYVVTRLELKEAVPS